MNDALSTDRFHVLVAAYGADPNRWPDTERGAAVRCLVETEAARTEWRNAADVDTDLDSAPGQDMSVELMSRVLAIADLPVRQSASMMSASLRHALPYAAAAAIALVVGLAVPSPFRDAPGAPLLDQAEVVEPEAISDTDNELTTLALVDARSFADDELESESDSDDALANVSQLAGLALQ